MRYRIIYAGAFFMILFFFCPGAVIAQENSYTIIIKDHHFSPVPLKIPAGQKVKIIIDNQDPTAEEFESAALNREKVVSGGKKATIFVGPLKPGSYKYFGEFHEKTAQGVIVAE
jgi:plastocyanin